MTRTDIDWATGNFVDLNKPEEQVRQDFEKVLHYDYGWPKEHMDIEVSIQRGSNNREKADLVLYESNDAEKREQSRDIYGIVEFKRPDRVDGVKQLTSYMTATSSIWGVWTNGKEIEILYRESDTGKINKGILFQVPHFQQSIDDIGTHTFSNLTPASNLKLVFRRLLNELYTNTNISRREKLGNEMTKLLFCKLQDEQFSVSKEIPRFRVGVNDHANNFENVRSRIEELFSEVKRTLSGEGVFEDYDVITLENRSVAYVVGELQRYSLTQTDEDAVGAAFEVFAESKFAGEKGEFFTHREIVKTAIALIDPKPGETIIDPACGSGGFLICALQHIWEQMRSHPRWKRLTAIKFEEARKQIARKTIYGLEKESDLVKIAKAYMAIIGDGKSRIAQANSLHACDEFSGLSTELVIEDSTFKQFDIIFTNPPFGSKETKVSLTESAQFALGHKWKKLSGGGGYEQTNKAQKTPAQELFIERCLQMLKPGGRMAIVLPETYAHAPSKKYILQFLREHATIKAVIDLPHNSFRPHCNAKTLLWIIEKNQYQTDIVLGVAEEMGRDHHGKIKYRVKNGKLSEEIWNDMPSIRKELDDPCSLQNKFVFRLKADAIKDDIYVPRHYWRTDEENVKKDAVLINCDLISMNSLIDDGIVKVFGGHGAPPNQYKGTGEIPYVRVGDIGNWMIYKNPTAAIPRSIYEKLKKKKVLKPKDLVFVRDGSYRIGDVGIILPSDTEILLDSHCLVFRVMKDNEYDIDGLYLAYLLRHPLTQRQLRSKIFINTTLPDIRDRWRSLRLPISRSKSHRQKLKKTMNNLYTKRSEAEAMIKSVFTTSQ